jgi:hypothetical protein
MGEAISNRDARKVFLMFIRKLLVVTAALSSSVLFAADGDVDDIISKHIAALGGAEKIRAIKSSKTSGKMVMGGGQMEASMVAYMTRPNQTRVEIEFQGQKIVQGFDGTTSWAVNPMSGSNEPMRAPAEESKTAADNADPDGSPLLDYKKKGTTVELAGKEDVGGAMAHKLKLVLKSGTVSTIFLDANTYLPSKIVTKRKQMGQEMEMEVYPTNYKAVEGVQMAFTTEVKVGGRSMMQTLIEKIEPNVAIDGKIYGFPAAPAPAPVAAPKQ